MEHLERLLAIEAIRLLKARYFHCVDTKDWHGLDQVYAEDVVFDRSFSHSVRDLATDLWDPPLPPEPLMVHGRDAVIAMARSAVGNIATVHHGHDHQIHVTSTDTANGIWAMSDELRDAQGRLILAGRGHYHDTYRRTADGWRIATSRLTRLAIIRGDGVRP